jgi:plasmid stabilization system protein ParE
MSESHEYEVVLHSRARADLDDAYQNAARHAPGTASRWVDRFHEALTTLSRNPQRCPLAPESRFVDQDIHEFHFGRRPDVFRVFFWIDGCYVRILRIRRASRRGLTRRDIEQARDED